MIAHSETLNTIFSTQTHLVAPLFQRPYVWQWERNWVPLWETVRETAQAYMEGRAPHPRFLGSIVLEQIPTPMGRVASRQIIDGQQRLTTLQVLLAATRDRYAALCESIGAPAVLDDFNSMLENKSASPAPEDRFKVWPTNADRVAFKHVMSCHGLLEMWSERGVVMSWESKGQGHRLWQSQDPQVQRAVENWITWTEDEWQEERAALNAAQRKEADSHLRQVDGLGLDGAYFYFWSVAGQWLAPEEQELTAQAVLMRAQSLLSTIQNSLRLVVIDLGAEDDPQQIYETMNARGEPLLPADLVKNFLFREAARGGEDVDELHRLFWRGFEQDEEWWRRAVSQGRLSQPRFDLFLRHYMAMTTRREVVADGLFEIYRSWARSRECRLQPREQMQRFEHFARIYQSFESPNLPSALRRSLGHIQVLEVTPMQPLLLELFDRHKLGSAEMKSIARDLESWALRRAVCGLTSKSYNRFFLELLKHLGEGDDFSHLRLRAYLLRAEGDSSRWPSDREFERAWVATPLFKKWSQARVAMLLRALEDQMRPAHATEYVLKSQPTIEHLMPRSWQAHWPAPPGEAAHDQREVLLHTIGNLTLLSAPLNSSISNGPWIGSNGTKGKKSSIADNDNLWLNKSLPARWNEEAIEKRGRDLFKHALKLWPRPTSP